jgi:lactate dehydrogenase-like 2-hydroxyacid dehydrogenase
MTTPFRVGLTRDLRNAAGEPTFGAEPPRVKLIARHGVGYDSVDVATLSARGVLLTNTPDHPAA